MHQSVENISPSTQTAKSAAHQLRTFTTKSAGVKTYVTKKPLWRYAELVIPKLRAIRYGQDKWVI